MYTNQVRHWMNVKKRYSNIKQSAKKKNSNITNPPTGNQGPPIILTPEEECYLNDNRGGPSIDGIMGGIETDDESVVAEDICSLLTQVGDHPISPDDSLTPSNLTISTSMSSVTIMAPLKPVKPDLKRKWINETKRDYEEKLMKLDITVQELKVKKLNLEIELHELRKRQELSKMSES